MLKFHALPVKVHPRLKHRGNRSCNFFEGSGSFSVIVYIIILSPGAVWRSVRPGYALAPAVTI